MVELAAPVGVNQQVKDDLYRAADRLRQLVKIKGYGNCTGRQRMPEDSGARNAGRRPSVAGLELRHRHAEHSCDVVQARARLLKFVFKVIPGFPCSSGLERKTVTECR